MRTTERIQFAWKKAQKIHSGQMRKGTSVPYWTHLANVAFLVAEAGGSEDQIIAAILHDAIEDQGDKIDLKEIHMTFGPIVAAIVSACTIEDKDDFEGYVGRLKIAMPDARLVIAADKLDNIRSQARDLLIFGEESWERFRGGKERVFYKLEQYAWVFDYWAPVPSTGRPLEQLVAKWFDTYHLTIRLSESSLHR